MAGNSAKKIPSHSVRSPCRVLVFRAEYMGECKVLPLHMLSLLGTSVAYLIPDHIPKKFIDGWNAHVPLTFLTDKGCLLKNKSMTSSTQDLLMLDNGYILTTPQPLLDKGELDLTFDEWHQAWQQLLDLIQFYLPAEFILWEVHYFFIFNNNCAEMWPLFLAYNTEFHEKSTQLPINHPSSPSVYGTIYRPGL